MRTSYWGVAFLLLSSCGSAFAQTIVEGMVHDNSGSAVANASIFLGHPDVVAVLTTITDADGKFRISAVEAGAYRLRVQATGYYVSTYDFVLRSRQPVSLSIELQKEETVRQSVEVSARYLTVDPEKTGSSYTFSRQDIERLPDPLVESTNDLVNNLMPGASDSHDNFLAVRGTEFSLHEFINGVSFLDKDRKSTRLNSSHGYISYAVFCLKKKKQTNNKIRQMILIE